MPFTRPALSSIVERIQSDVETRLPEVGSLLRRSILKVLVRVLAGALHLLYGYLDYQVDQIFATSADELALNTIANEYGLSRTAATYATGSGTATGTDGTIIPASSQLQNGDGYVYLTDEAYTIGAAGVSGSETISFTAQYAGEDYLDDAGVSLSFVSPISGVNTTVTVDSSGITGGADSESNDALRERILARKRLPPHGGSETDYVNWMKEVSGVTRAWAYPSYSGNGTIAVAFVRDGDTTIIPTGTQASTMLSYLESHTDPASGEEIGIPVTALPGLFIMSSDGCVYSGGTNSSITLASLEVNLTIEIYPNTDDVQDAVVDELEALVLADGGPGQTIRLSRLNEAIGNAVGEQYHKITSPTTDISATFAQVHILDVSESIGSVTFQDYSG